MKQHVRTAERKNRKARMREYLRTHKLQNPCPCGERDPEKLTFHHVRPGRTNNKGNNTGISSLIVRCSWAQLFDEISKCVVVCRDCHDKIHSRKPELSG